jgi:hypothetical protein
MYDWHSLMRKRKPQKNVATTDSCEPTAAKESAHGKGIYFSLLREGILLLLVLPAVELIGVHLKNFWGKYPDDPTGNFFNNEHRLTQAPAVNPVAPRTN